MRIIGLDIHRAFAEAVVWDDGKLKRMGRVDMRRPLLEAFAKKLSKEDVVVVEATGNASSVAAVIAPHVKKVVIANPKQVRIIAHAKLKTDARHAVVAAESVKHRLALHAQPRFGQACRVIDPGVNYLAVTRAHASADRALGLNDDDLVAGAGEHASHRETDDACADDETIDGVHVDLRRLHAKTLSDCPRRACRSDEHHAAVRHDNLSGYVVRVGGREERRRTGQICWL